MSSTTTRNGQAADVIKAAARGRWPEILTSLGGVAGELLDGKNHPCPKCGGTDRFRLIDREAGACFCNQCFAKKNGDGVAAVQWLLDIPFPAAVKRLAEYLGVNGDSAARHNDEREIVATYDYYDEHNKLLYQVVRYDLKDFKQRAPKPGGGWTWSVKNLRKVPYRLPGLLAADPAETVYIVEGEKDADRLVKLGLIATTNVGGAGKWQLAFADFLVGRNVVILLDNDDAGRDHAEKVGRSLVGKAASIKVIELPGLPEKGDVSDWLDSGGTIEELERMVEDAPEWQPSAKAVVTESTGEGFALTDTGNAERFAHQHGADVRFCHAWGEYLTYDGRRWSRDSAAQVEQFAKATVRSILQEAANEEDDERRKVLVKFARQSESAIRRAAMLRLAQSEPGIPIPPEALDSDPWLLNCPNGTIDLQKGELRHRREDFLTKLCPTLYDPAAVCPIWIAMLERITAGRQPLIDFLRRLLGYCLTGDTSEQVLPIFHGIGANGKSTLLIAFMDTLGTDYTMKAVPDLLMVKRGVHPTERADLFGKRFVAAIETDEGRRLAEALVKDLTGGDRIRARRMYQDNFEFAPTHKIVLAANHKPVVKGTDHAIWRRLKLVPFGVVIPPKERDKKLPQKLRAEFPGLLAWCVQGCLEWQAQGLGEPMEVANATGQYQLEQDTVLGFLNECCIIGDGLRAKASDVFAAFREWSGDKDINQRDFGRVLTERGFQRFTNNGVWYRGVGLQAEQ